MSVKVSDIIEFLEKNFELDAEVRLDKDGWMEDDIRHTTTLELISKRAVFDKSHDGSLIINN